MLLTGTFARSVDAKLRVAIPKRFRDALEIGPRGTLYLAPGTDRSIGLYTEPALARMAEWLTANSPTQQDVRAFSRLFYAQAEQVELDAQGRFRIPTPLAQMAGLAKDVVLLGVNDHVELWNPDEWQKYLTARASEYDQIAERAFGGRGAERSSSG
jgi:MraZ protein